MVNSYPTLFLATSRAQLVGQRTGDQEAWGLIPDTGHE